MSTPIELSEESLTSDSEEEKDIICVTFLTRQYTFSKPLYENILSLCHELRNKIYILCFAFTILNYLVS